MEKKVNGVMDTLRNHEKQLSFLLKLSDVLRPLSKPVDIEEAATKLALDFMDADRCYYSTIEGDNVIILHDAVRGDLPSVSGVHTISSFALYKAVLGAGHPFFVDDACTSKILDEDLKKLCLQFQYGAFINVPVIKNGKPVGLFSLVQCKSRKWTDTEMQLTIEAAERTWAAVERAKAEEALRKSEEKYRMLFDSIDEGFSILEVLFDDKGKAVDYIFLEMNNAHEAMTGLSQAVVGRCISEIMPDIEESVLERLGNIALTGKPVRYEQYVSSWNRWFDVHSSRVGGDESRRVANVFSNITDRKQAEEKLKVSEKTLQASQEALLKNEKKLQSIFKTTTVAIGVLEGPEHKYMLVNPVTCQMLHRTENELLGKTVREVFPEAQDAIQLYDEVYSTGKPFELNELSIPMDKLNVGNSGQNYFNLSCEPLKDSEDKIYAILVTAVDVTEQVETRKKVEQSEKKFGAAIHAVEGIIWTNNAKGEMEGEQPGWTTLTGQSFEEYKGYGWSSVVHPDDAQPTLNAWNDAVKNRKTFEFEHRLKTKDGSWRLFSVRAVPAFNEDGSIAQWVGVHTDITEQREAAKNIQESEERFRSLADQSPMIVFIVEPGAEIRVSYFNAAWLHFTGQNFEEALGRAWDGIVHPDDVQSVFDIYVPAFQARQPYTLPAIRLKRYDGEYRWHTFKGNPRNLITGEFNGFIGVGFDIHEQKLAEEKLAYRTALLEAHNEASVDGILLVDAKGKIISFNQRFIEIWNMPQHIVDAKDDEAALSFAMTQLENPQQFINKVKYLYEHPTETSLDELEFKDGKMVERNGYPVIGEDGAYYAWSWTFRDITEQKNYEKTILESEERFRLLSDEMPQFVWTGNAEGNLGYFNEAVYKYSGLSKEDITRDGWLQIVHPDDREENIRLWMHSISTGVDFIYEHRFKRADGEFRWQLSRAVPQRNTQGVIQQWIGTSTDIQDQKNIEEKLGNLVAERTKELQRSNDDLQQFAHVASHDLKEPIRKIKTFIGRLEEHLDGSIDEVGTRYIERIHAATDRMFNMIDGVLTYSTTTNASTQKPELVNLNEVLKSIENDLDVALYTTGATLQYKDLPHLEGAPVLLYQLFYNLINNANKFVQAGVSPVIKIESETFTEEGNSFARITVQDNGIGFNPEHAGMIFETFTRLNSKDKYEGTGLGLSLCKKIVERHGGIILASGTPDNGATFTMTLPVQQKKMSI